MKKVIKVFLCTLVLATVLILTQAATLSEISLIEREFFIHVWSDPKAWINTVIFWKWLVVVAITLFTIVYSIVWIIVRKIHSKNRVKKEHVKRVRKSKKKKESVVVVSTPTSPDSDNGVVRSNSAPTSNPGKFIRVSRDKK